MKSGERAGHFITVRSVAAARPIQRMVDFCFLSYIKGKIYKPPLPRTIDEIKERIKAASQTVTTAVLLKVWDNLHRRLKQVIKTKGGHIEHMKF